MATERNPFVIVRHASRSLGKLLIVQARGFGFAARGGLRFLFGGRARGAVNLAVFGRRSVVARKADRDEGEADEQEQRQFRHGLKSPNSISAEPTARARAASPARSNRPSRVEFAHHNFCTPCRGRCELPRHQFVHGAEVDRVLWRWMAGFGLGLVHHGPELGKFQLDHISQHGDDGALRHQGQGSFDPRAERHAAIEHAGEIGDEARQELPRMRRHGGEVAQHAREDAAAHAMRRAGFARDQNAARFLVAVAELPQPLALGFDPAERLRMGSSPFRPLRLPARGSAPPPPRRALR